ncbi:pyridoxal-5'-phosphate-dependent protein subunit beta [Amycolatopsis antarctica]|uniref:Pyridoxal-5'-phosphate-dependent protein subunit beta n=1 Tax=Amycolatopsis antarctica TaxID=1854586 RepID=A0A263D1C0_9PSEU|nr:PLP-dependent lyase/thiolase [Amycolatopsis antarctica]OZM72240.1 pyridoxal-5'-phosphate-dependent protein subunit beta [Amycolatopsis antarctica]
MQGPGDGTDLDLDRIERACREIDPVFRDSPQFFDENLGAELGARVLVKVETLNPLRSFKGRGADFLARSAGPGTTLVCESTGNFGQAVAYTARSRGLAAEVFVRTGLNPVKLARMRTFGATVHEIDDGREEERAREFAGLRENRVFVEDGRETAVAEGAGTVGVELLTAGPVDTVVVPVGDGALITGMARWIRAHAPTTRIVGVCAEGASAMVTSLRDGRARAVEPDTIAEGMAIRVPVPASMDRMRVLVDEVVEVDDAAMLSAMRTALRTLGLVLEPAGAAGLAAIAVHDLPGDTVATVLTGSNIHPDLLAGLAG